MMMVVRPYRPEDEGPVADLWRACFPGDPLRNDPSVVVKRKGAFQPELFLIGEIDGRVVATAVAGYDGHRGWIYHVAVRPGLRRQGYGRQIMREAESRLRVLGCPKVNLQVRPSNREVVEFYERLGYAVEDRISMGKPLERES